MPKYLIIGLIALKINFCFAQPQTGFYFRVETKRKCTNQIFSFDQKVKYCITQGAVIKGSELESVDEIKIDLIKKTKTINLRLTKSGFKTLKAISETFPNNKLLLVVESRVVGEFDFQGKIMKENIPVTGSIEAGEIDWIFEKLSRK